MDVKKPTTIYDMHGMLFNCHAYVKEMDRIISCKFSSFSIHDVSFRGTLPTPPGIKTQHSQQLL